MKKNIFTFDFLVVLLTLIAGAYVMYSRVAYHSRQADLKGRYEASRDELLRRAVSGAGDENGRAADVVSSSPQLRNILFAFKSSSAKKVSIVGDFNDWIPQNMEKDARGMWAIALKIPTGEYAYNFIIDGRPTKDFNNPKTKDTGRGFVSSFLEVRPFEPDNK